MDLDALVEVLAGRVAAALKEPARRPGRKKPVMLLLPREHNPDNLPEPEQPGFDREQAGMEYELLCARTVGYNPDWECIDRVFAFGLTIEAMGKIAAGIMDDGYTRAMGYALLKGKPVNIMPDQIELFQYEKTAPPAYYGALRKHLELLEQSGLVIGRQDGGRIRPAGETVLAQKLVTEKDIAAVPEGGTVALTAGKAAIITDLARDLAQKRNITIIRR